MNPEQAKRSFLLGSVWTLAGQVGPALAGILFIPRIVLGLGNERFALLTMAWMVIGYFGLFDLGLTRAITQLVAGSVDGPLLRKQLAVGNVLLLFFGSAGGALLLAFSWVLATRVLLVPAQLMPEVMNGLWIMAVCLPITLLTASYRSIAEGKFAFGTLTLIRAPLGIANFLVPWLIVRWTLRLDIIITALMAVRLIGLFLHASLVRSLLGPVGFAFAKSWKDSAALLKFGGWITVSNLISPVMSNFDRFVIGSMISLSAVSYYVTPYEAVTKMWIVAGAIGSVLFPYFSRTRDPQALRAVFSRGLLFIAAALIPCVLIVLVWGRPLLVVWINQEFAAKSTWVARILAMAVLVNALAFVPFSLIQGQGRPDVTAKFHLLELPFYGVLLVAAIRAFGIEGAAGAYLVRVLVDAILLALYGRRFLVVGQSAPNPQRPIERPSG